MIRLPSADRRGLPGAIGSALVGATDALGQRLGGRSPASAVLSDRKLWGSLQRGAVRRPPPAPTLALSFDCDYQADTDALDPLRHVLDRCEVRASVACIGLLVRADPAPYQRLVADGHEIVNHSFSHPDNPVLNPDQEFWDLDEDEMAQEVGGAQDALHEGTGMRPTGFRSPHFKDAHRMLGAIERFEEITYVSTVLTTTSPTGLPYHPARQPIIGERSHLVSARRAEQNSRLLQVPLIPCPEHRWSPFCSYHAIRRPRDAARGQGMHDPAGFTATWARMLERARPSGFASVYFDPKDVAAEPEAAERFGMMVTTAQRAGWSVTTLAETARTWSALV